MGEFNVRSIPDPFNKVNIDIDTDAVCLIRAPLISR